MTTAACRGFVYATAVMGVTGARSTTSDLAAPLVARTRASLPDGATCRWRRARRQHRRAGRRDRRVRRRRHRRLGPRARPARPPRRPHGGPARPHRADRGPRRGGARCADPRLALAAAIGVVLLATSLRAASGASAQDDAGQGIVLEAGVTHQPYVVDPTPLIDTDGEPWSLVDDTDQAPHAGLLRLHQLPRRLRHRDEPAGLRADPPGPRRPRAASTSSSSPPTPRATPARCCAATSTATTPPSSG